MGERNAEDVLSNYGAGKEAKKAKKTPERKASDVLSKYGAAPAGAKTSAKPKAPSVLEQVGSIASGIPRAVVGTVKALPGESVRATTGFVKELAGVKEDNNAELVRLRPRKGESPTAAAERAYPVLGGTLRSVERTAGDVAHPSRLVQASKDGTIVGKVLEDLANVATLGRAGSIGAKAAGLNKVAKVADAPNTAARAAVRSTAGAAKKTYEHVATGSGKVGDTVRALHLDPDSRLLRRAAIEPAADKVSEGVGEAVKRGEAVTKILGDLDEQRAMTLVGEGEATALAKLRANLPADEFDSYVADTYGDAVGPKAVELAADVVDGKAPELAARIDEALRMGREAPGGRADRAGAYVAATPSREPQLGFKPLPQVVEARLAPLQKLAPRTAREAVGARVQAGRAAAQLEAVKGRPQPAGRTATLETAAMRVQAARDKLTAATKAGDVAENKIMGDADAKAATAARSALKAEVRDYRRVAQAEARRQADELAGAVDIGRPALPTNIAMGLAHPMRDVADELREGLGHGFAGRQLFAKGGTELDVWLEQWNNARGVVPEITSAMDYSAVAADVVRHYATIRELRSGASGALSRGTTSRAVADALGDPGADDFLRGSVEEAVERLAVDRPTPDVGADALASTYERIDAGAKLRPLERRVAAVDKAKGTADAAEARLPVARTATVDRLVGQGRRTGESLGKAEARARITENVARSAETRASGLAGKIEAARRDVEYSIDAAPARLRPVLQRNREAASLLTRQENRLRGQGLNEAARLVGQAAEELPVTLERLKAAGADFDHFVHLRLDAKPTTAGVRSGLLPKIRKGREERQRKGSATYDRTVRAQTQAEIDTLKNAVAAEAVEKIKSLPFTKRFDSIERASAEGFVAWDAKSPFEKAGQITPTTVFVPEHLFTSFRSYFKNPRWDDIAKRFHDPLIQGFKVAVLPLSPSWQVGNVFGNALLAAVGGGVGPIDLATQIGRAVKAYRASGPRGERNFDAVGPRRLYTAGPTHEEFAFLRSPEEMVLGQGKASRGIRAVAKPGAFVVRKSWALNGFVDDLGRSAVYLSKLNKGATPEAALRSALRAMGDFSRMTPFERRVVRRIMPFYAWSRHLTQLAFRMPIDHPLRSAWTLHLADLYGRPDEELEDLPSFLRGAVPLPGGRLLGTRALNPFEAVGGPVLNPSDLPRSLSPAIKMALANAPGSPGRGRNTLTGRDYTRPEGTGRVDELGRPLGTPPSLLKQLTDIAPQKRLMEALQGRGRVVRYESGDPVLTANGPIETEKTPQQGLLRFLGFPVTNRKEAEALIARMAEKEAAATKRRDAYRRREAARR